jgi:hypothetical protein
VHSLRTSISKDRPSNIVEPNITQIKSFGVSPLKTVSHHASRANFSIKNFPASSCSKVTPSSSYLRVEDVDIKEEKSRFSHKSSVNRVKELSETDFISCSNDKTIKFWKTNSCKEYRSLKVSGYVYSILPIYLEESHHSLIIIGYAFD